MKRILFVLFLVFLTACGTGPEQIKEIVNQPNGEIQDWKDEPLKDINSGEIFKISDFAGKQVILESMAVWCPTCTAQQRVIKKLHEELGDSFVSVSLDTDPNEDEFKLKAHAKANGFTWRYVISPIPVTKALIAEFGITVVNAPAAPVVLVCEDQSARLIKGRGVKSVERLKEEMAQGC